MNGWLMNFRLRKGIVYITEDKNHTGNHLFRTDTFLLANFMRRYRKHAIVIILVIVLIIMPTLDVACFCSLRHSCGYYYTVNILIVKRSAYHKILNINGQFYQ